MAMSVLENLFLQIENVKVLDNIIPYSQYFLINLSESNRDLLEIDIKNPEIFENYIENILQKNKAKVAFGGYTEERNLYNENTHFSNNQRNIHIGIDLWTKAGTPVLAALDGRVYGFGFNSGKGNYGPTIILEHTIENNTFYTLYGHLSTESIENLETGKFFSKGQTIATLGDSEVNGGYSPHLHFQIIKNLENNFSDYPGVCSKKDLSYYIENCPNPNLLLKIS